jgi:inhibitor of KinA
LNRSVPAIVQAHTAAQYRVLMMGFVPGCPYMGGLDPTINLPRKTTPRARVPAGSVGIANHQAVIYPFETPGGWNIVGRTPLRLFDANRDPACVFAPFDLVKFVPISREQYSALAAAELATELANDKD